MDVAERLLEQMSVPDAEQVHVRMSWAQYLELPDELFAEFVDGVVVVSPRPANIHGAAVARMTAILVIALPTLEVITEGGVRLPRNRLRGPDIMVVREVEPTTWVESPPLVAVEVLSRSTRAEDLGPKADEYADAGVRQLWLVDPARRTLEVRLNVDRTWQVSLSLDDTQPTGTVTVGEHGSVYLDLGTILRRPALT